MSHKSKNSGSKTTNHLKKHVQNEIWKVVPGFKNYEVSNNGNIRNKDTKKIRKLQLKMGYHYCCLSENNNKKNFRVHRLVAKLFIKNPHKYNIVNHLDGNKTNNNYKNLEWTTISGNNKHATDNNLTNIMKRRISQYVGEMLYTEYDSVSEASKATGIHMSRIVEVCKGTREEYEGYVFKYTDINPNEKIIDLEKEGFKNIKTFPNYWINSKGQIYSKPFKKFLKSNKHKTGCSQVQLTKKNPEGKGQIKKTVLVHNLVAIYFLKKPEGDFNCVTHKDGDKSNNDIKNLKWKYVAGAKPNFDI
ncbi:intron encoded HNH endonuclease [Acanthamoeba polyphaga mimivirus]|uniref:Intron encoded HNH endonuclease n=2 Tax=Megamimivirinae TaxID=3044648 RepID=A0A2L2DM15_MIMIV|nr:HNH endonuclease [Megavirus chiliensis]AEQ32683.1 intron HNH endonuclease [Megavirus chiliensis]AVG46071.1 intron encoded HNH endonuclease [Acanthamoeba polyphaga mimivirus]AVG47177.1 intron encoded HNH endonuclease [Acanthamoeba polyphaga mimivirus]